MQSLAALGRHTEALTLLRARQSVSRAPQEPDQALHEALVGLSTRLSCNLLTEAFMEVCHLFLVLKIIEERHAVRCISLGAANPSPGVRNAPTLSLGPWP